MKKLLLAVVATAFLLGASGVGICGEIHEAAQFGEIQKIKQLLMRGVPLEAKDKDGHTALDIAAGTGQIALAEFLISEGADVNARSLGGTTPLYYALSMHRKDMVELLISKGAELNITSESGSPLSCAILNCDVDIIKTLIDSGAEIDIKNDFGWTPLHTAIYNGKKDAAELLISNGLDLEAKTKKGETPLILITKYEPKNPTTIIKFLIAKGVDVNTRDDNGMTALAYAKKKVSYKYMRNRKQYIEVIKILEQHGATE